MNNVLKPCPFCGGEACVKTSTTYTPSSPTAKVYCKKCKSSTALYSDFRKDGTFLFDAIEAWNRRAGEEDNND